jgi:hypothetical protein
MASCNNSIAKSPGGESAFEVEQRAVPEIYNLLKRPERNIVCVGEFESF